MYLSALSARGFRNLEGTIPLAYPLAVLIGENNAGKSNIIDALRLVLEPEAGPRGRRWISPDDFRHDGRGIRAVDRLELAAEFCELSDEDSAPMVTCLSPSRGPRTARLRVVASLRVDDKVDLDWYGGDSLRPDVERWAREAITFTYLPPLRDAAADLRPGRDNRLIDLVRALAPNGHTDRSQIEEIVRIANAALDLVPALASARGGIQSRVDSMTSRGPFAQETNLAFAEPRFDRIVGTLRAMAGSLAPLELSENGLGYNNLVYMAVLLAGLSVRTDPGLQVLLVEEPEAHLHPQLQDLLMRHLENQGGVATQVVVTTHSPNFASSARVERATVVVRQPVGSPTVARAPVTFGLEPKQLRHLRRFLDVTKAALLFARGVILVEGIAEQLLVPALAQRLGRPLPPAGIAVINVGGVAFEPFVRLFGPNALPYRCSVISDSDPPRARRLEDEQDATDPQATGGAAVLTTDVVPVPAISPTAATLLGLANENAHVFLAQRTLEWDLVAVGNWEVLLTVLSELKPRVAANLRAAHSASNSETRAAAFLEKVEDVKGPFAQELADALESALGESFLVPDYLVHAIAWASGEDD